VADFFVNVISWDLQIARISNFARDEHMLGGQCTCNLFLHFRYLSEKYEKFDSSRSTKGLISNLACKQPVVGGQCTPNLFLYFLVFLSQKMHKILLLHRHSLPADNPAAVLWTVTPVAPYLFVQI